MIPQETFRIFGETLKHARQAKNRSLEDIASSIRVNRRHLEAIEAGDLDALPQGPYALAFVREYARAVNVPLPEALAPVPSSTHTSPKDPKVVSRPHSAADVAPLTQVARETAKFAKTAVKTVSKTTENLVDFVETGGKEALEVLTSRSLWEEAEGTRRERLGLAPLPKPVEPAPKRISEEKPLLGIKKSDEPAKTFVADDFVEQEKPHREPIKVTKRATNVVIVLLALVFGAAAFFTIRMSKKENPDVAGKDYVPAPVEKPQPLSVPKRVAAPATASAINNSTLAAIGPNDSLHFTLRATQPVWVSIAPDGIPAYRGELKPGESHQFHATKEFVVNIGNQKSVAMTFNGQPLAGLPAIQGSNVVVRDLVLMRDKVTLNGAPVDVHALTTAPRPVPPTPVVSPVPSFHAPLPIRNPAQVNTAQVNTGQVNTAHKPAAPSSHTSTPANHGNSNHAASSANTLKGQSKQNGKTSTGTHSKKSSARSHGTPSITPVEPVPPRP